MKSLSKVIMEQTFIQSENAIMDFSDPVNRELQMAAARYDEGLFDPGRPQDFQRLFTPFLEQSDMATSILLSDGGEQNWLLVKTGKKIVFKSVAEAALRAFIEKVETPYFAAQQNQFGSVWFARHCIIDKKERTSSAAVKIPDGNGGYILLVINMQLNGIDNYIEDIRPLRQGHAVIVIPDDHVIGLPESFYNTLDQEYFANTSEFPVLSQWALGREILDFAYNHHNINDDRLLRRDINGTSWLISSKALFNDTASRFNIIVMLPEKALVGKFMEHRKWVMGFTLLAMWFVIIHVRVLARSYSRPIEALVEQSRRVSQGDLDTPEDIPTNVLEVRQLVDAHSRMRKGLKSLMKLERDLQLAKQIQQSSMPQVLPRLSGFDIAAWNSPADATGGDTFDVIGLKHDESGLISLTTGFAEKAILLLADATGHGMGPALSVTQLRAMLRMGCHITPEIAHWVRHINQQLHDDLPAGRFITAWLGELCSKEKTLTYFSAGQSPLLHYKKRENKLISLSADTVPLGVMKGMDIEVNTMTMEPGDIFAVVSDGIFEATNEKKELMGEERIKNLILENMDRSARTILEFIQESTAKFTNNKPADDDRTILIIKRV